ncbi:MAG: hypothetical protein M1326_07770, partial [Cyanobacteria bacterium]|nr:hypothetical protein [Cyanobacteriota bacterium]
KNKIQMKLLTVTILSSVLCLFPLSIWLVRSYLTVGSPIFPFFQSIFPTPRFWSGAELTNNFMIQTTMSTTDWLKMGFIKYPFLTYFKTESFLEATRGYPGVIYMLLLPIQALIFIKVIFSIIKRIAKKIDFYYLYLLVAFFTVGIITRYYRYLWPFQLLLEIISIIYINRFILNFKYKMLFKIAFFLILIININNVIAYFRFFPIITDRFFKPNYSKAISNSYDPISFINRQVKYPEKVKVLDVSKNILPRFHTKAITYECNWYWVKGLDEFAKARKNLNYSKKLIDGFDYIITSNPIGQAENYCVDKIEKEKNLLKQVFSDQYYLIFKVNVQSTK